MTVSLERRAKYYHEVSPSADGRIHELSHRSRASYRLLPIHGIARLLRVSRSLIIVAPTQSRLAGMYRVSGDQNEFPVVTALARDDGIRTLYRFMPYPTLSDASPDTADRRLFVERVVSNHEIGFPTASQFNDPFEAALRLAIPRRTNGPINTEKYVDALRNCLPHDVQRSSDDSNLINAW
jgi:hypothetical protein